MMKYNTYFCDIDGTIFKYRKFTDITVTTPEVITSVSDNLNKWFYEGHHIVLTTARPETLRDHTEFELKTNNINYHQLVMGIERGPRYLINDMDPEKEGERAIGINLKRDKGFE
jgi:hypothetical protein